MTTDATQSGTLTVSNSSNVVDQQRGEKLHNPDNPHHHHQQQQQAVVGVDEAEMTRQAKHNKKWNRRFKIFFCCLGYKKNKVRFIEKLD